MDNMTDESAFPHEMPSKAYPSGVTGVWIEKQQTAYGLTKRELAAFMAMQGLLSNSNDMALFRKSVNHELPEVMKFISEYCVTQADALLSELNKKEAEKK